MAARTLARVCGDLFAFVQLLAEMPAQSIAPAQTLRAQLASMLESAVKQAGRDGIDGAEVEEARFALVAWADETLMKREWNGRAEWQSQPLQMQFYRTLKAGNEFFEHLQRLRPDQQSAREIYLLTLVFGFEGQYAGEQAERQALISHQFQLLRSGGRARDVASGEALTPAAYELEISLPWGRSSGVLRGLGLMVLGLGVLYGILWVVLWFTASTVPPPPVT